ncbi:MAG: sigma-70 factor domain-containing protein, partial [Candidatus Aminicenantales bacterium]
MGLPDEVQAPDGAGEVEDPVHSNLVKLYLKEAGSVSLLDRDKEVALARKIERGHRTVVKAFARIRYVHTLIARLGESIRKNPSELKKVFDLSEDHFPGSLEEKKENVLAKLQELERWSRHMEPSASEEQSLWSRARPVVQIVRILKDLHLRSGTRSWIIQSLQKKMSLLDTLEEKRADLESRISLHKTSEEKARLQ